MRYVWEPEACNVSSEAYQVYARSTHRDLGGPTKFKPKKVLDCGGVGLKPKRVIGSWIGGEEEV